MSLQWIHERPALWDADKARIVGGEEPGVFDVRYSRLKEGEIVPGEWWRIEEDGRTLGYGWMDVVWGDAEILLATAPDARGRGVGTSILEHLEREAHERGINYLYNSVRPAHPHREQVSSWLAKRGYEPCEDGSQFHTVLPRP